MKLNLEGVFTALVTPFQNGKLDKAELSRVIEQQIIAGIDGIVAVGTTGESPTLTHEEHMEVIRIAIHTASKRCPIIAGTGSNSTAEALTMTLEAEKLGADAALLVLPYYNKPSQEGLFQHFKAIASAVHIPIILYSIPSRCGIEISIETTARLAESFSNIIAIKESGGSVERVSQLRKALPDDFKIISGDDSLTIPFMSVGASGVISVASNLIPSEVREMVRAYLNGDIYQARALHLKYYNLFKDLFIEPNPAPIKYALSLKEKSFSPTVRLPLCELQASSKAKLEKTLSECGVWNAECGIN